MRPDAQQDKPRNTLDTLNDHLFMQLARLNEKICKVISFRMK
jgi:hypothetical protein